MGGNLIFYCKFKVYMKMVILYGKFQKWYQTCDTIEILSKIIYNSVLGIYMHIKICIIL